MHLFDENLALFLFALLPFVIGWPLVKLWRRAARSGKRARWPQLLAGNVLFLMGLLSLILLGGEIYFRFFYDTTDSLGYTKVCERWAQRYYQINKEACRDNVEYVHELQQGRRRFTFLGDSFTAGHGIKNVEDRFVNRLRSDHPDSEFHALAQPGFETIDELEFISDALENGYQLDCVVLVYCLNDISDLVPEWIEARRQIYSDVDRKGWLKNSSYFINFLFYRWKAARNPHMKDYFNFLRETGKGEVWEQQKERLKQLQQTVESHGGRLMVVTFPLLHTVGKNYQFQTVHDSLNQFWQERNIPHLDLLSVFTNMRPSKITVNRFDAHPNEYAHRLAADAIGRFLESQLSAP